MSETEKPQQLNMFAFNNDATTDANLCGVGVENVVLMDANPMELMRISATGLWVNPDIPADECAKRVLEVLRPMLQHTIDAEVERRLAEHGGLRGWRMTK